MSEDLSIPNPGYRGSRAGRYGTGPGRVRPGMDPDTRRLMMFAAGLGGLLVILVGASALVGRHAGEVPVVLADTRPIREKPLNPGGMKIDGAENDVFSGKSDAAEAKLAPASENPDTKAFRTAQAAPSPIATTPAPAAAPAPTRTAPTVALIAPPPPAPRMAVAAVVAPAAKPALVKPPAAVVENHPAATGHQAVVQLAAVTSEEAAHTEWQQLSKRMPDLLNGRQPNYSRTERDGHAFWRVRTTGFTDVTQARTFCEHVRAKGGGCSVTDF